uniref:Calcium-binding and coiled-coil domain-containing protein 2 n=1 Tax=Salvator merianae TaxID=96440 RepID=A0A8D0EAC2_SALMN
MSSKKKNSSMEETCNNSDEPPTSTVFLDSCHFSQVVFTDVEKVYVPGADITCHYTLSEHITPRRKDWVGIFKVGWKTTREYYTFMWAPLPSSSSTGDAEVQQVLFKAYYLPKDDEYYQFCYVDQDGLVRGASIPFQFCAEAEDDMLMVTTQGEMEEIKQHNTALLEVNQKLKEKLVSLQQQNEDLQEKLKATEDFQRNLDALRTSNEKLNVDIDLLKNKVTCLESQNSSTEAELHQIKEENKKLLSEKEQLENKLRTTLGCVDQLQSQVESQHSEVENLLRGDQDKAVHLKQLKEENHQLNAALLQQQNSEKNVEEMTLMLQTLKKEKEEMEKENQRLRQKNEELMTHLPDVIDDTSTHSTENSFLVYGNPYSVTPGIPVADLVSIKKCPMCDEIFPSDIGENQYSDHVQSHLLHCPFCSETFDRSSEQVYEDHVFCHGLD